MPGRAHEGGEAAGATTQRELELMHQPRPAPVEANPRYQASMKSSSLTMVQCRRQGQVAGCKVVVGCKVMLRNCCSAFAYRLAV